MASFVSYNGLDDLIVLLWGQEFVHGSPTVRRVCQVQVLEQELLLMNASMNIFSENTGVLNACVSTCTSKTSNTFRSVPFRAVSSYCLFISFVSCLSHLSVVSDAGL